MGVVVTRSGSRDISGNLDQSGERYYYTADNKRVSTARPNGNPGQAQVFYVYGAKGEIGAICTSYVFGNAPTCDGREPRDVRFAGRLVIQNFVPVAVDMLGSVVANPTQGSVGSALPKYYAPFGEQYNETVSGTVFPGNTNFATYFHEETTGLNYAGQRFYNSQYGRFMSADPYKASAGAEDPGSWNMYSYVQEDPINRIDPTGEFAEWAGGLRAVYGQLLTNYYENALNVEKYSSLIPDHIENTQDQNEFWAKSQTASFRLQLGESIRDLSDNCVSQLGSIKASGETSVLERLVGGTASINFGSTGSAASNLQLGNSLLAGTSVSPDLGTQTAIEYFDTMSSLGIRAVAFTLGNFVLLNSVAFYKDSRDQGITLLHEAFHATGLGDDIAVATLLRLPGTSTIDAASNAITAYLRNNCNRL